MTEAELVKSLSERFYSDFADTVARRVRDAGAVELLYRVATSSYANLPKPAGHKAAFRSAYVLEKIYFAAPDANLRRRIVHHPELSGSYPLYPFGTFQPVAMPCAMQAAFHKMGLVARLEGDIHFRRIAPRVFRNEMEVLQIKTMSILQKRVITMRHVKNVLLHILLYYKPRSTPQS